MKKTPLILLLLLILVGGVGFIIYSSINYGKMTVSLDSVDELSDYSVLLDNKELAPSGIGGKTYVASVRPGEHTVGVVASKYSTFTQKITVRRGSSDIVKPTLVKKSVESVAVESYTPAPGYEIVAPKFFGQDDWLVYLVRDTTGKGDGSIAVAHYIVSDKKWKVVDEGTSLEATSSVYADAPQDLISYVRGL